MADFLACQSTAKESNNYQAGRQNNFVETLENELGAAEEAWAAYELQWTIKVEKLPSTGPHGGKFRKPVLHPFVWLLSQLFDSLPNFADEGVAELPQRNVRVQRV